MSIRIEGSVISDRCRDWVFQSVGRPFSSCRNSLKMRAVELQDVLS